MNISAARSDREVVLISFDASGDELSFDIKHVFVRSLPVEKLRKYCRKMLIFDDFGHFCHFSRLVRGISPQPEVIERWF